MHKMKKQLSVKEQEALFNSSLVGLALSLPEDLPERSHLQGIVFGITLFTLLVQGATTGQLLRRLGLRADGPAAAIEGGPVG